MLNLYTLLAVLLFATQALAQSSTGVAFTGASMGRSITGLLTNPTELDRFLALSGSGQYATDLASINTLADTARTSWAYTITSGAWEDDDTGGGTGEGAGTDCEPVGDGNGTTDQTIRLASSDIYLLALAGYLVPGDRAANWAAVKTHIGELEAITSFGTGVSGNECVLHLGAIANVVEAALLLEAGGYSSWGNADRQALATWLAVEVFPVVSWGLNRKNNWHPVTHRGALAVAYYTQGYVGTLTLWDASTPTPAAYLSSAMTRVNIWLSDQPGDELDSDCSDAALNFGLQPNGSYPDDLRRPTSAGTTNCEAATMSAHTIDGDCSDAVGSGFCTSAGGHFYSQKAFGGHAMVCESIRRATGDTSCFSGNLHGGADVDLIDMAKFATNGDYQTGYFGDNTQHGRWIVSAYFDNASLRAARDDGSVDVEGGDDAPFTRITHSEGVAYP